LKEDFGGGDNKMMKVAELKSGARKKDDRRICAKI